MIEVIADVRPDILVLTDIDIDAGGATLGALADALTAAGAPYRHRHAWPGNAGLPSGYDLDGDGRLGTARDAQGYGKFRGDGALAILSRWPLDAATVQDFSALRWEDAPDARLPVAPDGAAFPSPEARAAQRLSSVGHWIIKVTLPSQSRMSLLLFAATPPVFDGPEDRNGLRGGDEALIWTSILDGTLGPAPKPPLALLGRANIDPVDGEGRHAAIAELLAHPKLQDPRPTSAGGPFAANPSHRGDPALDTAEWPPPEAGGPGNLRVDYVLPGRGLRVLGAGVHWPAGPAETVRTASRHRLVWVDVAMPHPQE